MSRTLLTPCRVPWMVAPSTGAVTLKHTETDTEPECTIVLGGGRMSEKGQLDSRRVEIDFEMCHHARTRPLNGGVKTIYPVEPSYDGHYTGYLDWLRREWNATGLCPNPGFFVATESEWLSTLPDADQEGRQHYVVVGRDGYVELIAERFRWREWMWSDGRRDDVARLGPVVETGSGA